VNLFIPEATAEAETLLSKRGLAYSVAISVIPGRAAEPEPSRQGPRASVRSRLGPAVMCTAPPAADLQEADPPRRGSLASPVPQAHASVLEAACTCSTVRCGAAVTGDIPSAATSYPCPPSSRQRGWEQHGPPTGRQKPAPKKDEGCP
jgi:hypothetical protein